MGEEQKGKDEKGRSNGGGGELGGKGGKKHLAKLAMSKSQTKSGQRSICWSGTPGRAGFEKRASLQGKNHNPKKGDKDPKGELKWQM